MIVTRKNKNGGPVLKSFQLHEDPDTGYMGYKIGYCAGCNEPLLVRIADAREVGNFFGDATVSLQEALGNIKRRITWKEKIIIRLGGEPKKS